MKTIATISTFLLSSIVASIANAAPGQASGMTNGSNMMEGGMMEGGMMGGGMMAVCMLFGVLLIVALVLGILALIKYLRSKT